MAEFDYVAIDPKGREKLGRLTADNDADGRSKLENQKLYVVTISPAAEKAVRKPILSSRQPKMSTKALTLFTRQMSSLMRVSPLEESLRTISRQTEKESHRTILGNVHAGVVEGQTLAEAMRREPKSFPAIFRAMVAAGENSGSLPVIMERLADLLEKQAEIRGKIISALAYPVVLTLVAIAVVTGLMVSVVPRVVEQFDNASRQLPLLTRIVIAVSQFLAEWWWAILAGLVIMTLLLWQALRNADIRYRFDSMLLRLPIIGKLIRDVHAARLARTLATMVQSGLPLLDGLKLTSQTIRNTVLRRSMDEIVERIRGGGSLSGALSASGHFPPLLVYLASSGESAGQLGPMLDRAADYLEREFSNFTSTALSLLEPAIIVIMGGLVALIILAILLPILQLQNLTGL
ncbi:type II secretion system inner membrane protein GspF [Sphingorhabdus sp. Alg239-R122]|uniref:type II secretion system inner membrane protein GspF n=1 Tax=Sphingorhabdus sp. Alg239-R122 TaxID=2305989 RepID=UPI0013DA87BA|nr:type II secretion system inner membrane protein GspF [Sphingorhabdus sp. Alg239-R122]